MPPYCLHSFEITYEFDVLDRSPDFARQFRFNMVVLIGLVDLNIEYGGLARLVTDGSLVHSKI